MSQRVVHSLQEVIVNLAIIIANMMEQDKTTATL